MFHTDLIISFTEEAVCLERGVLGEKGGWLADWVKVSRQGLRRM